MNKAQNYRFKGNHLFVHFLKKQAIKVKGVSFTPLLLL